MSLQSQDFQFLGVAVCSNQDLQKIQDSQDQQIRIVAVRQNDQKNRFEFAINTSYCQVLQSRFKLCTQFFLKFQTLEFFQKEVQDFFTEIRDIFTFLETTFISQSQLIQSYVKQTHENLKFAENQFAHLETELAKFVTSYEVSRVEQNALASAVSKNAAKQLIQEKMKNDQQIAECRAYVRLAFQNNLQNFETLLQQLEKLKQKLPNKLLDLKNEFESIQNFDKGITSLNAFVDEVNSKGYFLDDQQLIQDLIQKADIFLQAEQQQYESFRKIKILMMMYFYKLMKRIKIVEFQVYISEIQFRKAGELAKESLLKAQEDEAISEIEEAQNVFDKTIDRNNLQKL